MNCKVRFRGLSLFHQEDLTWRTQTAGTSQPKCPGIMCYRPLPGRGQPESRKEHTGFLSYPTWSPKSTWSQSMRDSLLPDGEASRGSKEKGRQRTKL
ncbi:Sialic Acid-Binding Ig-Like Lectin 16 [Manis pentadactyla]|nr:Sialic Acid-Binding Ig-Like Lectin 16 [Manis pentadactyla]